MMQHWKCRYCGASDGAMGCPWPVWYLVKCFVCLRVERYEVAANRNVRVEVVNPQYLKKGQTYAIRPSDFLLREAVT